MGHRVPYLPKVGRPAVIWDKEETGTAADKLTPSDIGIIYSDCMSRSYALTNCEALGSGGYGVLQKARVLHSKTFQDTELEKKFKDQGHQMVALKIIKKDLYGEHLEFLKIELEIVATLPKHEHIVDVYEVFETSKFAYIVFEYLEGGDLLDLVHTAYRGKGSGHMPEHLLTDIMAQCLQGLMHLHKHNICHRDLKLENVLIDKKGHCKIIDFGLASLMPKKGCLLNERVCCGTYTYTAPEILLGQLYHGLAVDVWSLGVMYYALANGIAPFVLHSDRSNLKEILEDMRFGRLPMTYRAPNGCHTLIRNMLQFDPYRRPSLEQIQRDLEIWHLQCSPDPYKQRLTLKDYLEVNFFVPVCASRTPLGTLTTTFRTTTLNKRTGETTKLRSRGCGKNSNMELAMQEQQSLRILEVIKLHQRLKAKQIMQQESSRDRSVREVPPRPGPSEAIKHVIHADTATGGSHITNLPDIIPCCPANSSFTKIGESEKPSSVCQTDILHVKGSNLHHSSLFPDTCTLPTDSQHSVHYPKLQPENHEVIQSCDGMCSYSGRPGNASSAECLPSCAYIRPDPPRTAEPRGYHQQPPARTHFHHSKQERIQFPKVPPVGKMVCRLVPLASHHSAATLCGGTGGNHDLPCLKVAQSETISFEATPQSAQQPLPPHESPRLTRRKQNLESSFKISGNSLTSGSSFMLNETGNSAAYSERSRELPYMPMPPVAPPARMSPPTCPPRNKASVQMILAAIESNVNQDMLPVLKSKVPPAAGPRNHSYGKTTRRRRFRNASLESLEGTLTIKKAK